MSDVTELEGLRRKTVEFCGRADAFADEMERSALVPEALVREMRELGYFGITIPREYGGLGLGHTGYLDDHPVARIYRDIRIWRIVDGTSEMQKTVIARDVLRNLGRYA